MTSNQIGLLTTILLGIFILIGAFIALLIRKQDKVIDFSIGLAFGVIVMLIITDLLPEVFESFGLSKIYIGIICGVLGFLLLMGLDYLVPDHHHTHNHNHHHGHCNHKMSKKESTENLVHIGVITTLALALHNIIEGMAVYTTSLSDPSLSIALAIGVGFHNIPLGMVIASSLYTGDNKDKSKSKTILLLALASISTFIGGLIMYMFKLTEISEILLGILLSFTLGMLIFIVGDELLPRIVNTKNKKMTYFGIILGIVILLISMLIG